jgi:hypothetical protein
MLKETTYAEKFVILRDWIGHIVEEIKKDLKNEHLKKDLGFFKTHFAGKSLAKVGVEEMTPVYEQILPGGDEQLGEFVAARWLLRHTDIYKFFEAELSKIQPEFSELQEIADDKAHSIVNVAVSRYGIVNTYLFCVMNSVVFSEEIYRQMAVKATEAHQHESQEAERNHQAKCVEDLKVNFEMQVSRLKDRYEDKLSGLQKKYLRDVDGLKKEVANLQRKLAQLVRS